MGFPDIDGKHIFDILEPRKRENCLYDWTETSIMQHSECKKKKKKRLGKTDRQRVKLQSWVVSLSIYFLIYTKFTWNELNFIYIYIYTYKQKQEPVTVESRMVTAEMHIVD